MMQLAVKYDWIISGFSGIFFSLILFLNWSCTPSELLYKEHALYNFTDEGFLSQDMVQTLGSSPYPGLALGSRGIKRVCTEEALKKARLKMLRIFLHTYFRIPPADSSYINDSDQFNRDYPLEFSRADYIKAEIDFLPVLEKGYIALQDTRSSDECYVVFRIRESNIIHVIRSSGVSFLPKGIRRDYDFLDYKRYERIKSNNKKSEGEGDDQEVTPDTP